MTSTIALMAFAIALLAAIAMALYRKRSLQGSPPPRVGTRKWFLLNSLLLIGAVVVLVAAATNSFELLVAGSILGGLGAGIKWWRRIQGP
jgi:MFS family permease